MRRTAAILVLLALGAAACSPADAGDADRPATSSTRPDPAGGPTTVTNASPATTAPDAVPPAPAASSAPPTTNAVSVVPAQPQPDPPPPLPDEELAAGSAGVAVAAAGGARVAAVPGGEPFVLAHEGLVFPVIGRVGQWLEIRTPCEATAWVDGRTVAFTPGSFGGPSPGPELAMEDAVVVLDPGHGGPNVGAVGPLGTEEKGLNVDIARRARDLLLSSHDIDWETGAITPGDTVPAAGSVWLTRTEGPEGADIETGLVFRATLANVAGAHAFVSIHNNAAPDGPSPITGAEVYYRVTDAESRRLGGLVIEELRRSFAGFDTEWMGAVDAGAKYRVRSDGTDLYGVLKNAAVPAVIAEGAYLSNAAEERLLLTVEFRQAYAEGIYRALVRFLTTDDPGSGFVEPIRRTASPGSGSPQAECTIPAQP